MNNPTKGQMQTVIDNLRNIEELANKPGKVDMRVSEVSVYHSDCLGEHVCGTVHCMAGWYAVALRGKDPKIDRLIEKKDCGYIDGARKIADKLGFVSVVQMIQWAHDNPEIWGNNDGYEIFRDFKAYIPEIEIFHDKRMTGIIKHLEGVRDRLPC